MPDAIVRLPSSFGITVSNARTGEQAAAMRAPQIISARPAKVSFVFIAPYLSDNFIRASCCRPAASRVMTAIA